MEFVCYSEVLPIAPMAGGRWQRIGGHSTSLHCDEFLGQLSDCQLFKAHAYFVELAHSLSLLKCSS
jgi:hypothetical protein